MKRERTWHTAHGSTYSISPPAPPGCVLLLELVILYSPCESWPPPMAPIERIGIGLPIAIFGGDMGADETACGGGYAAVCNPPANKGDLSAP